MKSLAKAKQKRVRAVALLAQGASYDEIAQQVGYSHRGSAHRAVAKALAEEQLDAVEHLRALEVARLDALQVGLWPSAVRGDVVAVASTLRIIQLRAHLLGLTASTAQPFGGGPTHLVVGPPEGNTGEATETSQEERACP